MRFLSCLYGSKLLQISTSLLFLKALLPITPEKALFLAFNSTNIYQ